MWVRREDSGFDRSILHGGFTQTVLILEIPCDISQSSIILKHKIFYLSPVGL